MGSSLRAAVSTVEGGCTMCSVGGDWGELVCTDMSSDWRLPSTWFWVGLCWRSKQKEASREEERPSTTKVNTSHTPLYVEDLGYGGGREPVLSDSRTVTSRNRNMPARQSLPGRGNCSRQHPFCVTALEIMKSVCN